MDSSEELAIANSSSFGMSIASLTLSCGRFGSSCLAMKRLIQPRPIRKNVGAMDWNIETIANCGSRVRR